MTKISDTTDEAREVQIKALRKMGPKGRIAIAMELSENIRAVAMDGIRSRHPEYSEEEVRHALFRMLYGDELFQKAWPDSRLLQP